MCGLEPSGYFVSVCLLCGATTLGRERRILQDGPPIGLCDRHQQEMDSNPEAYIVYCVHCRHAAFVLHVAGYRGDQLLFSHDCPKCNPNFTNVEAFTWETWISTKKNSSGNSSLPPETDGPSTSTGKPPDG